MDFFKTKFDEINLTNPLTKSNDADAPNTITLPAPTEYTTEFKQKYEFMKNLECATKEMTTNFMIQLQPTPAGRRKFNIQQATGISSFVTGSRFGGGSTVNQHETKLADMMLEQANNLNKSCENEGGSVLAACMRESSSYLNYIGTSKDKLDDDVKNNVFSAWADVQKQVIQKTRDTKKELETARKRFDNVNTQHVKDPIKVEKFKVDNSKSVLLQKSQNMKNCLEEVEKESQSTAGQLLHLIKAHRVQASEELKILTELETKLENRLNSVQTRDDTWDCLVLEAETNQDNTKTVQTPNFGQNSVVTDFNDRSYPQNTDTNYAPACENQCAVQNFPTIASEWSDDEESSQNQAPFPGGFKRQESIAPNRPTIKREIIRARALYDFESASNEELGFYEGQIIENVTTLDEDWCNGVVNGVSGYFPVNYVEIID